MRITFLLEVADQLWGGVKVALEDANWLSQRGHQVTIVSRSGPPAWMQLDCEFSQVPDFRPENLPDADVLIGTFWSTVPWVASAGAGKGTPVHLCQGYEGDNPENQGIRDRIEATYRLPGMHHVTISPHLTALLKERTKVVRSAASAAKKLRSPLDAPVLAEADAVVIEEALVRALPRRTEADVERTTRSMAERARPAPSGGPPPVAMEAMPSSYPSQSSSSWVS